MEYRTDTKEGVFTLKEYGKGLEVVSYEGEDIYLTVPEKCGKPVVSLGKKALLSCKRIRLVSLPETIEEVGDWAFAYCDELREIRIPAKSIRFGRGIFRECGKLRLVTVEGKTREAGALLAAAVTLLEAPYLFTPLRCGDDDWLRQWDARMLQLLRAADKEGYSKMVLCGEEDYGSRENNLDYFLNQKRKSKVRIAFMRLLNPAGLQSEVREELEDYLRTHTDGGYAKGTPADREETGTFDETWRVLLEEHGEDSEYYKLFTQIGCLTADNFDRILSQTGESCPEMKAWFLKYKEENIGYRDFFADLAL